MIQTYRIMCRRDVSELVSFRLSKEMKETLDRVAAEHDFTRSEFLRVAVEAYVEGE